MSDLQIFTGSDAETAVSESDFAGTVSPRNFNISESLMDKAHTLIGNAIQGKYGATFKLAEAFSTSDFTLAAFALVDQEMLAQYDTLPAVWREYTTVTSVNDFRPKRLLDKWRNTIGFEKVPELTPYPAEDSRGNAAYYIQVAKWGRRFALSWESWVNNEAINEIEDLPTVLATQARETEAINAISNLISADRNGVNTGFFKSANGNAPAALPLTYDNLLAAMNAMAAKKSAISGRQIASPPLRLVVPRALEVTANQIKSIQQVRTTTGSEQFIAGNVLQNVNVTVEPMLDYWNTGTKSATTWFILPEPNAGRPALWAAFLRGHETPDLRVKASTGTRVGGGAISPLEGSFELDDIQYRGRHVVGNQVGDPTFTYVSNGS